MPALPGTAVSPSRAGVRTVSRTPIAAALLSIALAGALTGCAARYIRSAAQVPVPAPREATITSHVVLVSIDGLRPDAIETFGASTLKRLMQEGSYTLHATTVVPSKTLPSHTSMLTGMPPELHGVRWNTVVTAKAKEIDLPTIFSVARSEGYRTAAFFSKPKFQPLQRPGTLDYSQAPGGWFGGWSSAKTMQDVDAYLTDARPNILFVHLIDPDSAGHGSGWMSAEYGRAVLAADATVARLLSAATRANGAGNFTVIVTADHGGHGHNHGSDDPRDVTIPWIAWGRGVKAGQREGLSGRTMDTAATVVWLLGLSEPTGWIGVPVTAAFEGQPGRGQVAERLF